MNITGSILDKYKIEKHIGNGTFSAVFKAKEKMCGRIVAIKALHRNKYRQGVIKYLEAETKAMGLLWRHPNIVSIHTIESGDKDYIAYIVMEYVGGPNLRELIKQNDGTLPLEDIICIGIDICNGLAHAHSHDIIHRDIKPKNILLTEGLSAKLSDFSIAQILEENKNYNDHAGTRRYMAPEQYTKNYDHRVDIYATGLILLEMCVGHLSFASLTAKETRRRTKEIVIPDSVPDCLQLVIKKAVQTELRKRYQTADDMRDKLDQIRLKLYELYVKELIEQDLPPAKFRSYLRQKQAKLRLPSVVASNIEREVKDDLEMYEYHLNRREIEEKSKEHYRLAKQYLFHRNIDKALSEIQKMVHLNILDENQVHRIDELYSEFREALKNSFNDSQLNRQVIVSNINESNYKRIAKLYECSSQYEKVAETFLQAAEKFENSDNTKETKKCYKKAAKFYKRHADRLSHNDSLEKVAECYKKSAKAYEKVKSYWRARRIYQKAAENYEHLAEIFEANQRWAEAGSYFLKATELYQKAEKDKKVDEIRKKTASSYFKRAQELYKNSKLDEAYKYCYSVLRLSVYIKEDSKFRTEVRNLLERIESALRSNKKIIPALDEIYISQK